MVTPIKSSLECVQMAWAMRLRDFRQWCKPEGQAVYAWKRAPLKHAIMACRSNMIDDAEAMLNAWQNNQNDPNNRGQSAFIPVMTTAVAPIQTPPDSDQVVGHSDWLDVVLTNDPLQRLVQMATMPAAFRCQIAFFCPDPHGAMMVANQFCLYWKNERKRTFNVPFEVGYYGQETIVDDWEFRVLDNSLYPDTALPDYKNLTIVTVDCTLIGLIPIIGGLGGEWDNDTDTGEQGAPLGWTPIIGGRDPDITFGKSLVVTEADVRDTAVNRHAHIVIDPETGLITQTELGEKP